MTQRIEMKQCASDEPTTRALVEAILAPLPERYLPITFERHDEGYLLQINFQMIFRGKPAREAIRRARDYVAEHQRAGWTLPAGVVNGLYE